MTSRPPITDSPWFWVYVFCTAALIALAVMGPKYQARQLREERSFQGRQRGLQQAAGQDPTVRMSTPERQLFTIKPLIVFFGLVLMAAWTRLWWKHFLSGAARYPQNG